ncbi:uncharacterized protein UTRI_04869_B [Ustilago trichophora]|uniref:Uncharacterized protein n=1 Tax=Ustilago trichophora TaxID=86804 RepID=A0A5C3EH57_9BASI|nr:uncharacterized protein UTRI_04869_B [Ustilago trichophora]
MASAMPVGSPPWSPETPNTNTGSSSHSRPELMDLTGSMESRSDWRPDMPSHTFPPNHWDFSLGRYQYVNYPADSGIAGLGSGPGNIPISGTTYQPSPHPARRYHGPTQSILNMGTHEKLIYNLDRYHFEGIRP